jgi:hypothetical protein
MLAFPIIESLFYLNPCYFRQYTFELFRGCEQFFGIMQSISPMEQDLRDEALRDIVAARRAYTFSQAILAKPGNDVTRICLHSRGHLVREL